MSSYSPKATFTVEKIKGKRVFTPVNKRAKTVVKSLGKRARVSVTELKSSVGKGSYVFYQWTDDKKLKAIKF